MTALLEFEREGRTVREVDSADGTEWVIDLGPEARDAAADVVGGDLLVVLGDGTQHELALPADDAEVFIRNGVLTVRTEATE